MRRDYFALNVRTPAGPADTLDRPTVVIEYGEPNDGLREALTDAAGDPLPADAIDVTARWQRGDDQDTCVVGLTHRLTGEFLLEVNGDAERIRELVAAARSTDDEAASYRVVIEADDEEYVYDKETLLVYDEEGSLLRQHSLIPSGVEL